MTLLPESDQAKVREALACLPNPVRLVFFTQTFECETCPETLGILRELAALSDQVTLEEYNFQIDREQVTEFGVDKVPAVAVVGEQDTGIRFYGIPSGYEFASLIDAILLASSGDSGLSAESLALIANVTEPTSIQVFVTPT